jgi:hypothetical protein
MQQRPPWCLPCCQLALHHRPWEATREQAAAAGFMPGVSYPAPLVDPARQIGEGPKAAKPPARKEGVKR